MAHRDRRDRKLRRLAKQLNKRALPAYIDLVDWLRAHGHAQTVGAAVRLIANKQVRYESHDLGFKPEFLYPKHLKGTVHSIYRYAPARVKDGIYVAA